MSGARGSFKFAPGTNPTQISAVSAWLRLQSSAQSAGEWVTWADMLNNNPASGAHMPNVGSNSGLPTAVFASGPDVVRWPVISANNGASVYGFWVKIKPTGVASTQYFMTCDPDTGGSSARKMLLQITAGGVLSMTLFFAGSNRTYTSAGGVLAANTATAVGFTYDNAGALETDKFKMIAGAAYIASTPSGPGTPGTLAVPTGNILIGDFKDSGANGQPFVGQMGPNVFHLNRHLTAAELITLDAFESIT